MRISYPNLELLSYIFKQLVKEDKGFKGIIDLNELDVKVFKQPWGSTALGFPGVGGCAMTSAYTTVICSDDYKYCAVFFGDRLAYLVKDPNKVFFEDLKNCSMKPCWECEKYS